MQAGPLVTVAIVSWNTRDLLRRCLESFKPEADAGRCDVWVVDNASSDGSAQLVRDQFPWVNLVAAQENLGFGPATNLVAGRTSAPFVGVANADIALQPGALDALLGAAEDDPGAGAVAPRLILRDGSTQHSVYAFPTIPFALVVSSGLGRALRSVGERFLLLGRFDAERPRRVPWAIAAFLLVRREAWDAIGGFDEHQWMYAEDLDIGWRLRKAGWATRYEPRAHVEHESSASTEQAWGEGGKVQRWQRSTYAWMLRRMGAPRTRSVAAIQVAGQAVRVALLTPAALVAPARYRRRRDAARWWLGLHRAGLASRSDLEAHR
ncbi:MAG: glycosyltransferase family 2 protein [Thermoleophilaceae bacterium]